LTGYGQEEDKEKSLSAGFHHHLVKPVDPASLIKMIAIEGTQQLERLSSLN
jgi:CheY-like chemotaxis protein